MLSLSCVKFVYHKVSYVSSNHKIECDSAVFADPVTYYIPIPTYVRMYVHIMTM